MLTTTEMPATSNRDAATAHRREALNWSAVIIITLLIAVSSAVVTRIIQSTSDAAISTGALDRERMLSQRIAGLAAQTALGDHTARAELPVTIAAFADSARLTAGPRSLDAAVHTFCAQARIVGSVTPRDATFKPALTALLGAARGPLLARLDAEMFARQARAARDLAQLQRIGMIVTLALLGVVLAQAFGIVRPIARQAVRLSHETAELRRLLTTDPLTGTLNRQGFHDRGAVEIAKAKRYNRPLSLLMIDPDHLEPITAAHGPSARETVLKALTETLFDGTRSTDLVGRVGGKAFAVLLPETDHAGAELLAERLRRRISELTVPIKNAMVSSTVSIGVAAAEKNASFFAPIVARADEALYEAQMRGRNRVFVHAA